MKKPTMLRLIGILVGSVGFSSVVSASSELHAEHLTAKALLFSVIAVVSFITADSLWCRRPATFRWYATWVVVYLGGRAASDFGIHRETISELAVWLVFVGGVYVALGEYVRDRLKQPL